MREIRFRHRHAIALPFAVLAVAVLVGGLLNDVDARGRVLDDYTDKPVKDVKLTHGARFTTTDANGEFALAHVPRTSKLGVDASGYLRQSIATTATEVRLSPLSVTIYAYDETKTPADRVKNPQARQGTKILSTGNESGQMIITPHPGREARVLVCGERFEPKEVTVQGVLMQVGLKPGGSGCPPLPTPSPAPGASPLPTTPASPTAPAPSPSPTSAP